MIPRATFPVVLAALGGCDGGGAGRSGDTGDATPVGASIAATCGIADLAHRIEAPRRTMVITEERSGGHLEGPGGTYAGPAPISRRQRQVETALPCLEQEAGRAGLRVEYPYSTIVN